MAVTTMMCGCAARGGGGFVTVGEGLTAASAGATIRAERRLFSAPDMGRWCRDASRVTRLDTSPSSLDLQVGRWLPLASLHIEARDRSGALVPAVPIALEVENATPSHVRLGADDPALNTANLTPITPGVFRLQARTVCNDQPITARLVARVRK